MSTKPLFASRKDSQREAWLDIYDAAVGLGYYVSAIDGRKIVLYASTIKDAVVTVEGFITGSTLRTLLRPIVPQAEEGEL